MAQARSVVVVGAGLGGFKVAEGLRQAGFEGAITVVGAEKELPYDRPPLSKEVLKGTRPNPPVLIAPEKLDALNLTLRLGTTATAVDPEAQRVTLNDGSTLDYDTLVIATGAKPREWAPGHGVPNVWPLRTSEDAAAIAEAVQAKKRLAVLGAGFIGCEVAATATEMGCQVLLLEVLPSPMARAVGPEMGQEVVRRHRAAGVDIRCEVTVDDITTDSAGLLTAVHLSDGSTVEVDAMVVGLGVTPDVDWLMSCGLHIDNGIVCNAWGETSHDSIYAVGDAARWVNALSGSHRRVEHWTTTIAQAAVVVSEIVNGGTHGKALDEVPYVWSDQFGIKIQAVGEPNADAEVTSLLAGPNGDRPLYLYSVEGTLTGAIGFGIPVVIMRMRTLIGAGTTLAEALQTLKPAS